MKSLAPNLSHNAEFFCSDNKRSLLLFREQGTRPDVAVQLVCVNLLSGARNHLLNDKSYGAFQSVMDASHLAMCVLANWPNGGISELFKEALADFSAFTESEEAQRLLPKMR